VADDVEIIREQLPVPGAWAYGRKGDVVIVVADLCYSDDEIARFVAWAKLKTFGDAEKTDPSP
jgi:hypothetical protein